MTKDLIYFFSIYFIPMGFGLGKLHRTISHTTAMILMISCMLAIVLSMLPYLLSNKCPLEILIRKHPIRNLIRVYRPTPFVYFILIAIMSLNVFNYLLAFNLIHLF